MAENHSFLHRLLKWNKKTVPETVDAEQYAEAFGQFKKLLLEQYQIRIQAKTAKRLPINLSAKPTHFGTSPARAALYFDDLTIESEDIATEIDKILNTHQRLLLIGDPGAGKTTILLFAAINILQGGNLGGNLNLGGNFKLPPKLDALPLILNLATWQKDRDFKEWYAQSIAHTYSLSPVFVEELLRRNAVVPFFDGFDEVAEDAREDCFQKMGAYFGDQRSRQLIVCSRKKEYAAAKTAAPVYAQVEVQPLSLTQIQKALFENGQTYAGDLALLFALDHDEHLAEAVETPFYFNTASFLFGKGERTVFDFSFKANSTEGRQEELVEIFVTEQVLSKRDVRILKFLAKMIHDNNYVDFELIKIQPSWSKKLWVYFLILGCLVGLTTGLIFGAAFGVVFQSIYIILLFGFVLGIIIGIIEGIAFGLYGIILTLLIERQNKNSAFLGINNSYIFLSSTVFGVFSGLLIYFLLGNDSNGDDFGSRFYAGFFGLVFGLGFKSFGNNIIQTSESRVWSWQIFNRNWLQGSIIGLLFGLSATIFLSLIFDSIFCFVFCLLSGAIGGAMLSGIRSNFLLAIVQPYQRFRASSKFGFVYLPIIGFLFFLFGFLKLFFSKEIPTWIIPKLFIDAEIWKLILAITLFALLIPLNQSKLLQHFSLRLILYLQNKLPLRLVTFLDRQTDQHIFEDNRRTINGKKQRGATWRFRHKILQDYFAKMPIEPSKP